MSAAVDWAVDEGEGTVKKNEVKRDAKRVEDRRAVAAMSDREIDAVAGGSGMIRAH